MSLVGALFSGTAEATASGSYVPMSPSRLLDTRSGLGAPKAAVAGNHVVDLQVTGRGGVPASGVGAVVLNVTAVGPTSAGNLTVFPAGQVRPNTSNLNFVAGQTVANLVIVKVGTGGKVSLVTSGGQTNLIGDVMGWYPSSSPVSSGALALVSADPAGASGNVDSYAAAPSRDGRLVVFSSRASDLVAGDTNDMSDVFVRDMQTGQTSIVDLAPDGSLPKLGASGGAISSDGRYVAFTSQSTNLVVGDTNQAADVFVKDLATGTTTRVSVASNGSAGNAASGNAPGAFSSDGHHLAFVSDASNLVTGDTNGQRDVFVRSLDTGVTTRVSVSTSGAQGDGPSGLASVSVSANGRFVAFESLASNLDPADTGTARDVFVRDTQAGTTSMGSVTQTGTRANGDSFIPTLSDDGRYLVFSSLASDLVATDTKGTQNVFRRDLSTGVTELVSVDPLGAPANVAAGEASVSADGQRVAFTSAATNLVADPDYAAYSDIIVKDMQTGNLVRVSTAPDGKAGSKHSSSAQISSDGTHVGFASLAANLLPEDTNAYSDVFLATLP
jgi:Tol biopolymer transport system component